MSVRLLWFVDVLCFSGSSNLEQTDASDTPYILIFTPSRFNYRGCCLGGPQPPRLQEPSRRVKAKGRFELGDIVTTGDSTTPAGPRDKERLKPDGSRGGRRFGCRADTVNLTNETRVRNERVTPAG